MKHMVRGLFCLAFAAGISFSASAEIYRAVADVVTEGDGLSWESPMSITNGIASVAKTGGELWLKGETFLLTANMRALAPAGGAVTVRGGFAGTETSPEERAAGVKTTIDGQHLYTTFTVACNKSVTLERIILTHSLMNGLSKTGSSTFTARDCDFNENGWQSTETVNGRGAYVNAGNNYFTNCTFKLNFGLVESNYGSSGLHAYKASRVYIDNCLFERNGYAGVGKWASRSTLLADESPITMRNTVFRGNRATVDQNSAVIRLDKRGDKSVISHCQFVANEECGSGGGGVFSIAYLNGAWNGHTHHIDFDNCTFAYNVSRVSSGATALTISHGIVTVKNCIFFGNLAGSGSISGVDISVTGSDGNCTVSHCLFDGDETHASDHYKAVSGTLTPGEGIIFGNPQFVSSLDDFRPLLTNPETTFPKSGDASPALVSFMRDDAQFAKIKALDVHLLSSEGYFTNDGTEHQAEGVKSDAIDKGDGDVGAEPEPNGGKLNLGCYGGTMWASKTPTSSIGIGTVGVTFPTEHSQPKVTFEMAGSGAYSATAVVKVYTNDALAYTSASIPGLQRGSIHELYIPMCFVEGDELTATVTATADDAEDSKSSEPVAVVGTIPPWNGKGGDPDKVIHVRYGARGGDGTSWTSALPDLQSAIAKVSGERNEIWLEQGPVTDEPAGFTLALPVAVVVRGGFACTENAPEERTAGTRTVFDGKDQRLPLTVTCNKAVTIDRLVLTNGSDHGLYKSGGAEFRAIDCDLTENAKTVTAASGRAAYVNGGVNRFEGCLVSGNTMRSTANNIGICGINLYDTTRTYFDNCVFEKNGYVGVSAWYCTSTLGCRNSPVTVRNTIFRGNRSLHSAGAGHVKFYETYAGHRSAFSNCVFVANTEAAGDSHGGCIVFSPSWTDDAHLDVVNCTFAYNVNPTTSDDAAGITVEKGSVDVKNCIFYGNRLGGSSTGGADIVGAANVSHTLFAGPMSDTCKRVTDGGGNVAGDPNFVSSPDDFAQLLNSAGTGLKEVMTNETMIAAIRALDLHLLSSAGYFTNDGVEHQAPEGTISDAIDKGDGDVGEEPEPNGGKRNLGAYGGTKWASKTAVAEAKVASVEVSFPTNEAQPKVTFALGGSGAYSATAVVKVYANGSLVYTAAPIGGLKLGMTEELWIPMYFTAGDTVTAKVELSTSTSGDEKTSAEVKATGTIPPWSGKGGDAAKVIHVRPGARGGDGTSWTSAYPDLPTAVKELGGGRNEIWMFADLGTTNAAGCSLTISSSATIRGGFTGVENAAGDRVANARTVLDGKDEKCPMTVVCNASLTLERFVFKRSATSGLHKTGNGALTVRECEFLDNGHVGYASGVDGRALHITGGNNYVTNCLVARNWGQKAVDHIGTAGISASEGTALFVNGTTFEQNGHVDVGRWSSCPTISVSNMRLVARDCVFRGNRAKNDNGNGLVVVKAGNNGNNSQIKDCLFIGNEHLGSAGMVILESNWNNFTFEVSGCTFAYNVIGSSSALYLMGGALGNAPKTATCAVRDCIFWGNVADSGMTKGVDIRAADVKAICNLSYSLFGGTEAEKAYAYYSPTNTIVEGDGIVFGNPAFVTKPAKFGELLTASGTYRTLVTNETFFAEVKKLNAHLRGGQYVDEETKEERFFPGRSDAINAGDPARDYSNEPTPNGRRVNLGFYGNTPWASCSRRGTMLLVK